MIYRNINTGAEISVKSEIISPDWIPVPDKAEKVTPKEEAPKAEPPKKESAPKKRSRK